MSNETLKPIRYLALGQRWTAKLAGLLPLPKMPISLGRFVFKGFDRLFGIRKRPLSKVVEHRIPGRDQTTHITLRAYYPGNQPRAAMVYFHGGGCVIGDLDTHDGFCRMLAATSQQIVIAVDYRLAPEHRFPSAVVDALVGWNWVVANRSLLGINDGPIGVGGDSAGGYLALLICLPSEQRPLPVQAAQTPAYQFLMYPMADLRNDSPSFHFYSTGLLLTNTVMDFFKGQFLDAPQQAFQPLASPLLSPQLGDCPPTYLVTAQFDPLLSTGIALEQGMKNAGVAVKRRHLDNCMHQFISVTRVSAAARAACRQVTDDLFAFVRDVAKRD